MINNRLANLSAGFHCYSRRVAGCIKAWWPATDGAGVLVGAGCKAGSKVGSAPWIPPWESVALMPCGAWGWQRIGAGLPASLVVIFNSFETIFVQIAFGKDEVGGSNPPSSSTKHPLFT